MPSTLYRCPVCYLMLEGFHFPTSASTCRACCILPVPHAVDLALSHLRTELEARTATKAGRRTAKREARLAVIATSGKRCVSCHGRKPAAAYAGCESHLDGLQAECKACCKLRTALLGAAGGRASWQAVRDTLRDQAVKETAASGNEQAAVQS